MKLPFEQSLHTSTDFWLVKLLSLAMFVAASYFYLLPGSIVENLGLEGREHVAQVASSVTYPSVAQTQGVSDPSLAFGLDGIVDYNSALPFIDIMKMARSWIGHRPGQWGGMDEAGLRQGGYLDEHGWPKRIPGELESIGTVFAWGGNAYGTAVTKTGRYTLTYEGDGVVSMFSVPVVSQKQGEIVFDIDGNTIGNWGFTISSTDPQGTGNYIRNVKIVPQKYQELYDAGAIFNPEWLTLIKDARQVRFMDWEGTNNSTIVSWAEQRQYDDYTWTGNVPVSVQVRLANEIGSDPWFNIPFHADDNYVRTFATYVRDNLDPRLVARVELSNEVWNWGFQQAQDAHNSAIALWHLDPNDAGAGWINYYGMRTGKVMKIWTDVFGTETATRLRRVVGTQTVNAWLSRQALTAPLWQAADPTNYFPPYTYLDVLSPTSYFGDIIVSNEGCRNLLLSALNNSSVNANDYTYRLIKGQISGCNNSFYPEQYLPEQKVVADEFKLKLELYEGGQHVHHSAFVNISDADLQRLQTHLIAFVRSEQMKTLYSELWTVVQRSVSGPFMQFVESGIPSVYGSWGLFASLTDSTPRSQFLMQKNQSTPAWWENRGGEHFQQGLVVYGNDNTNDTLAGSNAEDYLIGRSGDDTLYPSNGNDGVSGGAGVDTVLFSGLRQEYTVTSDGRGYRVVGKEGNDYLYGVEILQFSDTVLNLSGTTLPPTTTPPPTSTTTTSTPPPTSTTTTSTPPPTMYTLTTSVSGNGSLTGTGISCPSDCTESYLANTQVTLTASPQSGAVFTGWGGACSGTASTCVLTMTSSQSVSALFSTQPTSVATFISGDTITTTSRVNVRLVAGGKVIGKQPLGATGVIGSQAPVVTTDYTWYYVDFTSGADGWVASKNIMKQ